MIVIADATRAQAVAGVMGGKDSEVTEATTDIFLEVANFNPGRIRAGRRALGLSSDASYRFERGVDVEIAPRALERVASLILLLAGGTVDGAPVDIGYDRASKPAITLRPSRVAKVLGETLGTDEIAAFVASVGFGVDRVGGDLTVSVPSWRDDVTAEVDLIEEVARLRGYDSFPIEIRAFRPGNVPDDPQWIASKRVREMLVAAGLFEARPMPFVAGGEGFVRLSNPLSENEAYLRQEILDTLARRAEYNLARMQRNVRLFEIGSVFTPRAGMLPLEELRVAALVMGRREPPHFTDPKSSAFEEWATYASWDVKALAEGAARSAYPGEAISLRQSDSPDELWRIFAGDRSLGVVRQLQLDAPVWASTALGFELSLGLLDSAQIAACGKSAYVGVEESRNGNFGATVKTRYRPLPATPAAEFDLALLIPEGVQAQQVEAAMQRAAGRLLEHVELFDRYVGEGVEPGFRSLAWRLTFRHADRTLRDKEIDARRNEILKALADELGVRQRAV
jgi:phenylalanyl-tRNA synthetase beta chain